MKNSAFAVKDVETGEYLACGENGAFADEFTKEIRWVKLFSNIRQAELKSIEEHWRINKNGKRKPRQVRAVELNITEV